MIAVYNSQFLSCKLLWLVISLTVDMQQHLSSFQNVKPCTSVNDFCLFITLEHCVITTEQVQQCCGCSVVNGVNAVTHNNAILLHQTLYFLFFAMNFYLYLTCGLGQV